MQINKNNHLIIKLKIYKNNLLILYKKLKIVKKYTNVLQHNNITYGNKEKKKINII
jgi:hypothetical protein